MQSFAPMVCIERAVLAPMVLRSFANIPMPIPITEASIAQPAHTEQAVLGLMALR
jgi:hypothetical protein